MQLAPVSINVSWKMVTWTGIKEAHQNRKVFPILGSLFPSRGYSAHQFAGSSHPAGLPRLPAAREQCWDGCGETPGRMTSVFIGALIAQIEAAPHLSKLDVAVSLTAAPHSTPRTTHAHIQKPLAAEMRPPEPQMLPAPAIVRLLRRKSPPCISTAR